MPYPTHRSLRLVAPLLLASLLLAGCGTSVTSSGDATSRVGTHSAPGAKRAQPALDLSLEPGDALPGSVYAPTDSMQAIRYMGFEDGDPMRLRFIEGQDDTGTGSTVEANIGSTLVAPFLTNTTVTLTDVDAGNEHITLRYTPDY